MFEPDQVGKLLEQCWSAKTSKQWSTDNPANGQCSVTALVLQDTYGGRMLKTRVGEAWHFYNEIEGRVLDMTASQFDAPVSYSNEPATRSEALADCSPSEYEELSRQFAATRG